MEFRLLHAPVPAELVAALYARAESEGKTLADLVTELLTASLAKPKRRKR